MTDKNASDILDLSGLQAALSSGGDLTKRAAEAAAEAEKNAALDFIRTNRSFQWDETLAGQIEKKRSFLADNFPEAEQVARQISEEGRAIMELFNKARKAGLSGDHKQLDALKEKLEALQPSQEERNRLMSMFTNGGKKAKAIREAVTADIHIPGPDFPLHGPNPHFLRNLKPSAHWKVAMDETGAAFDSPAVAGGVGGGSRGRYVAILVPEESDLKRLDGGDHAMDGSDVRTAELLTALYAAKPHCGILGVTLDGMAPVAEYAHVNYWYNLIERTIDLILRLVPLAKSGETRFSFYVEERSGRKTKKGGCATGNPVKPGYIIMICPGFSARKHSFRRSRGARFFYRKCEAVLKVYVLCKT